MNENNKKGVKAGLKLFEIYYREIYFIINRFPWAVEYRGIYELIKRVLVMGAVAHGYVRSLICHPSLAIS